MPQKVYGQLIYDPHSEEGLVKIDWEVLPQNVVGLDILSDWISDLHKSYHSELTRLSSEANADNCSPPIDPLVSIATTSSPTRSEIVLGRYISLATCLRLNLRHE
jgi:hypothetical protein